MDIKIIKMIITMKGDNETNLTFVGTTKHLLLKIYGIHNKKK